MGGLQSRSWAAPITGVLGPTGTGAGAGSAAGLGRRVGGVARMTFFFVLGSYSSLLVVAKYGRQRSREINRVRGVGPPRPFVCG